MIPGELFPGRGEIRLNDGRGGCTLHVVNRGDRPIQIGSHFHFFEANAALDFDRQAARGRRLDIPAGTAVRFEPSEAREVALVDFGGRRYAVGFRALVMGPLEG